MEWLPTTSEAFVLTLGVCYLGYGIMLAEGAPALALAWPALFALLMLVFATLDFLDGHRLGQLLAQAALTFVCTLPALSLSARALKLF